MQRVRWFDHPTVSELDPILVKFKDVPMNVAGLFDCLERTLALALVPSLLGKSYLLWLGNAILTSSLWFEPFFLKK